MDLNLLFALSNLTVMPFWTLMIGLPRWRWTERIIGSPLIALPPVLIYASLVLPRFDEIWAAVSTLSLPGLLPLLGSPVGATIAWQHFLAFDLLVGRWIYLDSRERSMNGLLMAPILVLALMLGPVGFLVYLAARYLVKGRAAWTAQTSARPA
jgi:hypothetical protein